MALKGPLLIGVIGEFCDSPVLEKTGVTAVTFVVIKKLNSTNIDTRLFL